jgi:asparagine synthase (glutamine-hydrolysing)
MPGFGVAFTEGSADVACEGEAVAVVAARFDDRGHLLHQLDLPPHASDGQIVLSAYRRWGDSFPQRLSGDFSAALWDGPRNRLVCAVDPLGVGVLFTAKHPRGGVGFASHLTPLRRWLGPEMAGLRQRTVARYLCRLPDDPAATSFERIERVPPGAVRTFSGAREARTSRYWSPESLRPQRASQERELLEAFTAELRRAVARRVAGEGTLGIAQSGGLDSASVLCLAAELGVGARLLPLHVEPWEPACQEASAIRLLEERTGLTIGSLRPADDLVALRSVGAITGEPRYLDHFPIAWSVLEAAAERSASGILTGLHGDLVSGSVPRSAWLAALLRAGRVRAWWSAQTPDGGTPVPRALAASISRAVPAFDALLRERRTRLRRGKWLQWGGLRTEAIDSLGLREEAAIWLSQIERTYSDVEFCRSSWLRWAMPHETEFVGRAAHALGMRVAHPFADRALVEVSMALPAPALRKGGLNRYPLRAATAGVLPEPLRNGTTKVVFNDFYIGMFRKLLPGLAEQALAPSLEGLVSMAQIRALVRGGTWSYAQGAHLWRCLAVNDWLGEHGKAG